MFSQQRHHHRSRPAVLLVATMTCLSLGLTGCGGTGANHHDSGRGDSEASVPSSATPTGPSAGTGPSASATPSGGPDTGQETEGSTPSGTDDAAQRRVAKLTTRQKVGQVIMPGLPISASDTSLNAWSTALNQAEVGNVFLAGRSKAGSAATAQRTRGLRSATTVSGLQPWVAVDQEGGKVQTLTGPGVATIPAARVQGQLDPSDLTARAATWGSALKTSGINMNLAPVADTVPAGSAAHNPPIGAFGRQYGSDPASAAAGSRAFAAGMSDAGVTPVLKHFPGLGLVTGNTDTTAVVTDLTTDVNGIQIQGFEGQLAKAPWVMVSSATYPRLDPKQPAMYSKPIVTGLLKQKLGFKGAVVSDDLCAAKAAQGMPLTQRVKKFLAAGGDLFLCSGTTGPGQVKKLTDDVVNLAEKDPAFAQDLDRAAAAVVRGKEGL